MKTKCKFHIFYSTGVSRSDSALPSFAAVARSSNAQHRRKLWRWRRPLGLQPLQRLPFQVLAVSCFNGSGCCFLHRSSISCRCCYELDVMKFHRSRIWEKSFSRAFRSKLSFALTGRSEACGSRETEAIKFSRCEGAETWVKKLLHQVKAQKI